MAKVEVRVVPDTPGYRLELYHEGEHIGEYEVSRASEEDREAKVREAERASDLLLEARKRTANGKITVRWNSKTSPRRKEIRMYAEDQADPGRGQPVTGEIPRRIWRKP